MLPLTWTSEEVILVLLRHGLTQWNEQGIFTGWVDVGLTEKGEADAYKAGLLLKKSGLHFDRYYTSRLQRAGITLHRIQEAMGTTSFEVFKEACFNERHYGDLQGMRHTVIIEEFGEEEVQKIRRSFYGRPRAARPFNACQQVVLEHVNRRGVKVPSTESSFDVQERLLPYWCNAVEPWLERGCHTLVVGHGNTHRVLMKYLERVSDEEFEKIEIHNTVPVVYWLRKKDLEVIRKTNLI